MKYPIYSYRDVKVGFMPPQCEQSDQAAVRGFAFAINSKDSMMNFSSKDFDLFKVGEFDTDNGQVTPCVPVLVVSGTSVYGVNDHD